MVVESYNQVFSIAYIFLLKLLAVLLWQEKNIINFDKDAALIITFSFVVKKKYAERWMYG
jgi:hypothetical protein